MAFNIANFAPMGNTSKKVRGVGSTAIYGAPTVYTYISSDIMTGASGITSAGYFNTLVNTLSVGDLIYAVGGAGSGGTLACRLLYVNANNGTTVDVVDGSTIATTDTY